MITPQVKMRPYAPALRNLYRPHVHERGGSDRLRRLADVVIGCAILAGRLTADDLHLIDDQVTEPRSCVRRIPVHRTRWPPFSDPEISDVDARSDAQGADLGTDDAGWKISSVHPDRRPAAAPQCAPGWDEPDWSRCSLAFLS